MLGLELILIVVLQFEGTRGDFKYYRSGDDVILPCSSSSSSSSCSTVNWFYDRDSNINHQQQIKDGKVVPSPRAARLNVDSNCSLIINNITAEDAGSYYCRLGSGSTYDGSVFLNVLTISPSSPDAEPTKDGDVTLQCSMKKFSQSSPCPVNSFHWLDETGTKLSVFQKDSGCISYLNVQHKSITNRKYTCQFVEKNSIKVEAHYTAAFKGAFPGKYSNIIIIVILTISVAVFVPLLLVVPAAILIRRRKTRVNQDNTTAGKERQLFVDESQQSFYRYGPQLSP
ncbi:PREDICTED: uncharacterized protein LOC107095917 [Cyprinodon variegatus]|uniref:uncharacterized protein LOC107095917 n=1 Tax=Cyprinodon variegatus TaxID=28743 RepID=UPI0007427ECD|nr:PREDICTED: uncharacterized protein LOC107095917 [Cyprinodon variegatus]